MSNLSDGSPVDIDSSKIEFKIGSQIEVYFPEEQIEYRLTISDDVEKSSGEYITVIVPDEFKNTFYKGEDFIKCRYVYNNIVYEFGGEIKKLIHNSNCYVVINISSILKMGNSRQKDRVSTKILCEYSVYRVVPGLECSRDRGFVTIKDASIGGVSFLTTDNIPINTTLKLSILRSTISILVEIKKHQIVNEKNFYGGRIVSFEGATDMEYLQYIQSHIEKSTDDVLFKPY